MNHVFNFSITTSCNVIKLSGTWEYMAGMIAAMYHIEMNKNHDYKLVLDNGVKLTSYIISDYKTECINKSGWVICRSEECNEPKKFWKYHCENRDFIDGFRKMEKIDNQIDAYIHNGKMTSGIIFITKNGIPIVNYNGIFEDWDTINSG
jgi:hypothetical protein